MKRITIEVPTGFSGVLEAQIKSVSSAAISSTLMAAKSHWEQLIQQRLTTTRADYLLGLNADNTLEFPDEYTGILTLRGKWANMLETGFAAYDMKPGFASGSRVKSKKDGGWYTTIPMRHRTPGTSGSAVGGKSMPDDIYAKARTIQGNVGRLKGTEKAHPPKTSWTGYQHKSGTFEGMVKNRKKYEKAVQNSYTTFRRVSDKSDPDSWKHPGYKGVKAATEVESFVRSTLPRVLETYAKNVMG